MSQPRGRFAGSRDSGQRQPRHQKQSSSNRQVPSYAKTPPRDSAQTASIFKTRSFQFLVDTVGAENIALGLESSMTRVTELLKGERFTPETAFHMETTLGLPHGFFDQPHPALTPETIARLKSPLDFVRVDEEPEAESEIREPALTPIASQQSFLEDSLSEEAEMSKKAAPGSPRAVRNSGSAIANKAVHQPAQKDAPSKSRTSSKASAQKPLPLSDGVAVENIRRANLHVLTTRNGSKVRLGVVMALSGSNMAHRLHGKKRMDDAEASRFTERLGLPVGWLDTPRTEAEIPESVARLLTPASRGRASAQEHPPVTGVTKEGVSTKRAAAKSHTGITYPDAAGDTQHSTGSANVPDMEDAAGADAQGHGRESPAELDGRSFEASGAELRAASSVTDESLPAPTLSQHNPVSLPFTSVTSLDNLHGIAPIAEALIKTLAGKARTGRLDELKALELLQQAVLL
jgi:hypothetical protein